ncbi:GumC family protein [uncultured Methylobacterium sp.]|uniref:GumC family protein n=1 Tax=uncultured Methylobacterium sp. TaxID=157278 RepID=UPI0035CC34B5
MTAIDRRLAMVQIDAEPMPAAIVDLRGIGSALWRRRLWILVPALLLGVLALAVVMSLKPRYQASAKVLLDPRGIQVFQNDLRPNNTTGDETGAEVESQIQVIASTSVLGKVARKLDLIADPEFAAPMPSLPVRIQQALTSLVSTTPAAAPEDRMRTVLRTLSTAVTVARSEKTFVLDIAVGTTDPEKSARIANAIGDAFLAETNDVRAGAAKKSADALNARLEELRKRLQRSEGAVETYRNRNNLIGANGRLVSEQQLGDLNNQLTLARTRASEQESRVMEVRRLLASGKPAEAMAEVTVSPTIAGLRSQYADATRAEGEARLAYGPRHPAMAAATEQVQVVRRRLAEELNRLARTAESDYERARSSEASLARKIESLKSESGTANQAQVRLRELERQAASDRTLYESFLNRAKDLQERQSVETGAGRIISVALPPLGRSGPSRIVIVLGALMLGGVLGTGLALLREQFDSTIRSGRQVTAETRLPVLAVMPGTKPEESAVWRLRDMLAPPVPSDRARVVVIAGLGAVAARTTLVQRFAKLIHAGGERALLVDGDPQGRGLTRALGAERYPGLTDLLAGAPQGFSDAPRFFDGLRVITAGTQADGAVRATAQNLREALGHFLRQSGIVVIDGGSVGPHLRALAAIADDIVVVVEGGRIALGELQEGLDAFGPDSDRVRGVVLAGRIEA